MKPQWFGKSQPLELTAWEDIESSNLLWAPSTVNVSQKSAPPLDNNAPTLEIVYPDNTTENHTLESEFNAYHLTKGAFSSVGMNTSFDSGLNNSHILTSIDDVDNPGNGSLGLGHCIRGTKPVQHGRATPWSG